MSDHEAAIQALHERARAFRSRIQVRAWEQRQIEGSKGTWYRVRRLLARAERAYAASDEAIEELVAAGARCDPVGEELEPRKRYVLVTAARPRGSSRDLALSCACRRSCSRRRTSCWSPSSRARSLRSFRLYFSA